MELWRERQEETPTSKEVISNITRKNSFNDFFLQIRQCFFKYTLLISRCLRYESIQQFSYTEFRL